MWHPFVALASCVALGAASASAAPCEPWPGEPTPLPTPEDPNPLIAKWAELRIQELAIVARRFEDTDPERAQQLWRRLLCMEPANDEALAGVIRSQAVQVHRPPLLDAPYEAPRDADAWSVLAAPIEVRPAPAPKVARPTRRAPAADPIGALRRDVEKLDALVRAAQFDAAIAEAGRLRDGIGRVPSGLTRNGLLARIELAAATAQLALGRSDDATASLRRALAANPGLKLDPKTTSPKVVRALEAARGATP